MKRNEDMKTTTKELSLDEAISEAARDFAKEMGSLPGDKESPDANPQIKKGKLWYLLNPMTSGKSLES